MGGSRWSAERARAYCDGLPWLVGCNFIPSTAVNQLEMWQAETFDPETIARELSWAREVGLNSVRVFLHDLAWRWDREGFKERLDRFLGLAAARGISALLVIFDDCWQPDPRPGRQPDPVPGVHNLRWLQSPGNRIARDPAGWGYLEDYVGEVLGAFGGDERVVAWDVYNEPGNYFLPTGSLPLPRKLLALPPLLWRHFLRRSPTRPLLEAVFRWARAASPTQPLTAGLWWHHRGLDRVMLEQSDVLSFHHYAGVRSLEGWIRKLQAHGRPVLCTEYMARTLGSRIGTHLPVFKASGVGAYSWGLVAGRTQTAFSWLDRPGAAEPGLWFHDLLRPDGSPYDPEEVATIRRLVDGDGH